MIHVLVILISWGLRAFGDAIDHGKGNRRLLDLWHVVMLVSYLLLIGDIVVLTWGRVRIEVWLLTPLFAWIVFEAVYRYSRRRHVEDLDDKITIPFINYLWRK